jgi:uncharacterized protein YggL (DUF469 family)
MKRRLRKKLHKGEFRQLGFNLQFDYTGDTNIDKIFDAFLDDFIGAVEGFGMYVGGGGHSHFDYFVYCDKKSVTPEQRQALIDWLTIRPDVTNVIADELRDAWYGWGKE